MVNQAKLALVNWMPEGREIYALKFHIILPFVLHSINLNIEGSTIYHTKGRLPSCEQRHMVHMLIPLKSDCFQVYLQQLKEQSRMCWI